MRRYSWASPYRIDANHLANSLIVFRVGVLMLCLLSQSTVQAEVDAEESASSRRSEVAVLKSDWSVDESPSYQPSSPDGQPLDARQVACWAACRWHPAIGLKQRARTIHRLFCDENLHKRRASDAIVRFLYYQAAFQEDIGAAAALRAYYGRIGVVEQQSWIVVAGQAVGDQQEKQKSLMDQGFAAAVDLSSLDRKDLDLQDQWLQSDSRHRQLLKLLKSLSGVDFERQNWVFEALSLQSNPLDCELLVAQALRQRCDLLAWQELICQIDEVSAPLVVPLLSSISSSFGLPIPTLTLLEKLTCHSTDTATLVDSLRQELVAISAAHQAFIEQSVREKCEQLQLAYLRHDIEVRRIDSWLGRLTQLSRLESLGQTRPEERALAEAGLLEARTAEVTRRLEAKLAEVSLAEAVGGLASNCCEGKAWLPLGF